jgi:C1A family cysteine protease
MYMSTDRPPSKSMKRGSLFTLLTPIILLTVFLFSSPTPPAAAQAADRQTAISGAAWRAEFVLDPADRQALVEAASRPESGLAKKGVSVNAAPGGISSAHPVFTGTGADQLRAVLYGDLLTREGISTGPKTIRMTGNVVKDQLITIVLEANPSTGYSWSVAHSDASRFEEQGPFTYEGGGGIIGGSRKQRLVLKALKTGSFTVHLVYRRPFDPDEKALANITMDMTDIPETVDLSNPNKTAAPVALPQKPAGAAVKAPPIQRKSAGLYTDYNFFSWTEHAGVTSVKDQKYCGSCWAFATVGALESLLKRTYGGEFDLSEQYLVSCNTDAADCADGGFVEKAHPYHLSEADAPEAKLGKLQSIYGAVLEKDMPYKGKDIACKAVDKHPLWMHSFTVEDDLTVDEIKQRIFDYGPVTATVCAGGPAFHAYKTGVYNTDESGDCATNGGVDHAILLVGWDNTKQAWRLKNSWGTRFGEQGYMWIGWGISNVGKQISYVENPDRNCSYKITPGLKSVPYTGAIVNVNVTASTLCPMPEPSTADITTTAWVDLLSQTWDDQKGTMKLAIHTNSSALTRSFGVTIGNADYPDGSSMLAVQQGYTPCKIGVTADTVAGTFTVTTNLNDCEWTAVGYPYYWILPDNAGVVQSGTKTVSYHLDPNDTGRARTGKITVTLGQNSRRATVSVSQPK